MRLINADALWKEFCKSEAIEERYGSGVLEITRDIIDNAPTIDAVPVVRCRDCKWKADTIGDSWCDFHEFTILSDDDFCSYGERKDDE